MLKLKDLILESEASEEAKKLGLKHIGFGRYVKPDDPDNVVAKSVNGKLKRITSPFRQHSAGKIFSKRVRDKKEKKKPEEQLSFEKILFPSLKVTKGGKPIAVGNVSVNDFTDIQDPHGYIRQEIVKGEQTIIYSSNIQLRSHREAYEKDEAEMTSLDMYEFLHGVSARYAGTSKAYERTYNRFIDSTEMRESARELATDQHRTWRASLSDYDFEKLADAQQTWQKDSTWNSEYRSELNSVINDLCSRKNEPRIKFDKDVTHLERGLNLSPRDAAEFLKTFKVGSTVVIPPSGWSYIPRTAREMLPTLGSTDIDMEKDIHADDDYTVNKIVDLLGLGNDETETSLLVENYSANIGVILKLYPRPGSKEMTAIACGNGSELMDQAFKRAQLDEEPPEKPDTDSIMQKYDLPQPDQDDFDNADDYEKALTDWGNEVLILLNRDWVQWDEANFYYEQARGEIEDRWHEVWEFDNENEVIRPGTVGQKVVAVKKHVFPRSRSGSYGKKHDKTWIVFEIDLVDTGNVDEKDILENAYDSPKAITL